jgi:hypothetical protein
MDIRGDDMWFHGTVHPRAEPTSRGLNYSLAALQKCCSRLPGKPLIRYHNAAPSGSVVHSYIGKDDALHMVGRVQHGAYEATLVCEYLKAGIINALSLDQAIQIDLDTGGIEPIGEPDDVGMVHVTDAGRGLECVIDSYAQWPEIEKLMQSGDSATSSENGNFLFHLHPKIVFLPSDGRGRGGAKKKGGTFKKNQPPISIKQTQSED